MLQRRETHQGRIRLLSRFCRALHRAWLNMLSAPFGRVVQALVRKRGSPHLSDAASSFTARDRFRSGSGWHLQVSAAKIGTTTHAHAAHAHGHHVHHHGDAAVHHRALLLLQGWQKNNIVPQGLSTPFWRFHGISIVFLPLREKSAGRQPFPPPSASGTGVNAGVGVGVGVGDGVTVGAGVGVASSCA